MINLFQRLHWSVSRKITSCFIVLALLIFISSGIVLVAIFSLENNTLVDGQKTLALSDAKAVNNHLSSELSSYSNAILRAKQSSNALFFYSLDTKNSRNSLELLKADELEQSKNSNSKLGQLIVDYDKLSQVFEQIQSLLASGSIEKADTLWNNNLVLRTQVLTGSAKLIEQLQSEKQQLGENRNFASTFAKITAIVVGLLGIIFTIFFAWLVSKTIGNSVAHIRRYIENMSSGDLSSPLHVNNRDELGELAKALNMSVKTLRGVIEGFNIGSQITNVSQDLKQVSKEQANIATQQAQIISEVSSAIAELNQSAVFISDNATQVSSAASSTLNYVQSVSATTFNVNSVVHQLKEAVDEAREGIEKATEDFNYLGERLTEVDRQSENIEDIVDILSNIAKETHLLSLNAAIEAAGSGQFGDRFHIVAQEVRNLSQKSSNAAKNVRDLINATRISINTTLQEARVRQQTMRAAWLLGSKVEDVVKEALQRVEDNQSAVEAILLAAENSNTKATQIKSAAFQQQSASQQILETANTIVQIANLSVKGSEEVTTTSSQLDDMSRFLTSRLAELKLPVSNLGVA